MENNDREFITGMLKAFSSIYKDANPSFSNSTYELATDPNISFVELKRKFEQICKDNGIPMSDGIKRFQDRMNQAIQKEEDMQVTETVEAVEPVENKNDVLEEEAEIAPQVEEQEETIVEETENTPQTENEVVEEIIEEEKEEEPVVVDRVEEVETAVDSIDTEVNYSDGKTIITVGPEDSLESIGKKLLDLKAKGIVAEAVLNNVLLSNNSFDSIDQMKQGYYSVQSQSLKNAYDAAMRDKDANDNINMAVVTPKGEDEKRMVMINNPNNPSSSTVVQFDDGKDFDHYVLPGLIDSFIGADNNISIIDDELGISRGHNFSISEPPKERYSYMAQMSNGNQLALTMAESSIDRSKSYINERLENITHEINKEANQKINAVVENEHELEKANVKVKQLNFNDTHGFINGIAIGVIIGIVFIVILFICYLIKVF